MKALNVRIEDGVYGCLLGMSHSQNRSISNCVVFILGQYFNGEVSDFVSEVSPVVGRVVSSDSRVSDAQKFVEKLQGKVVEPIEIDWKIEKLVKEFVQRENGRLADYNWTEGECKAKYADYIKRLEGGQLDLDFFRIK